MDTNGTTARQRIGLVIAVVLSVFNIVSIASPTPEGETGPPIEVLIIGAVVGVVGLVASVLAWRSGSRRMLRVVCAALIVMLLGALPAFFVDVPVGIKVLVGAVTLITLVACGLLLSPSRETHLAGSPS